VRIKSATKVLGKSSISRRFQEKGARPRKQLGDALRVMTVDKLLCLQFAQERDRILHLRKWKESERTSRTAMLETDSVEVE
jgi:hypothetical protein